MRRDRVNRWALAGRVGACTAALGLAFGGCGGGSSSSGSSGGSGGSSASATVTLMLHGGGNATITVCRAAHHYRTYAAGAPISFSGTVQPVPAAHWKIKTSRTLHDLGVLLGRDCRRQESAFSRPGRTFPRPDFSPLPALRG